MKILVVSDTHGRDKNLELVLRRERPFDVLIHCGDLEGREAFVEKQAGCPVYMVSGNNDFFSDLEREREFSLEGRRIFLTHGHLYGVSMDVYRLGEEAAARGMDVALFGHTHRPFLGERKGVTLFNPGSLSYPRQENRLPSYGVIFLDTYKEFCYEIKYLSL